MSHKKCSKIVDKNEYLGVHWVSSLSNLHLQLYYILYYHINILLSSSVTYGYKTQHIVQNAILSFPFWSSLNSNILSLVLNSNILSLVPLIHLLNIMQTQGVYSIKVARNEAFEDVSLSRKKKTFSI